jgi:hypothetical protein
VRLADFAKKWLHAAGQAFFRLARFSFSPGTKDHNAPHRAAPENGGPAVATAKKTR